ncbi:PREDICTED: sprT-like domain-containing protein Spartan [Gavialis gangeticus]|uniref:sprT-like domain-containing protein Spartan n=1 Tax=Gavialis gangeticus TaxID=94835 RepID=UPI00092E26A6|nr:PREDICTED: sprT-like domain-containing protein Spartan [Gavialis gangeticus]
MRTRVPEAPQRSGEPGACNCSGGIMDADFLMALQLQAQWEAGEEEEAAAGARPEPPARPLSVVDESWELLDPSPDVHGLFVQFNEELFWGRLAAVEVSWSPRMTLCAGVCSYEGRGGICSIRLSEPLLKLRPRKDLVETLLHEMIHALLFVTNDDRDRDSHGPEFCKHMRRINRLTGANVTIRHNFHDEVDLYRQHWWRCNGPCQNKKPYFGYLKRSMNRAPSARDFWWVEHQESCGGTFTKVKEPENYSKKGKEKTQPGKLSSSKPSDDKGKKHGHDTQILIPFSGNGYRLGGADSGSSEKITSSITTIKSKEILSSPRPSAARSTRPVPKNEIKFENSPRSNTVFPLNFDDTSNENKFASEREFPKLSVANTKVYKNVNGSPVKISALGEKSNTLSTNAKWALPSSNETPRQIFSEQTPRAWVGSWGNKSLETVGMPKKRPKTEDKTAFENFFIKRERMDSSFRTSTAIKSLAESTVSSASTNSAVNQVKNVSCPVCQIEVLESKINEHLDSCLS